MYIEDRLFSETSDEVLYSVTMTEDEYDLFSEFMEERQYALPSMETLQGVKKGLTRVQKAKARINRMMAADAANASKIAARQNPIKTPSIPTTTPSGKRLALGNGSHVQKAGAMMRNREALMRQAQDAAIRTSGNHKVGAISRPIPNELDQLKKRMLGL